MMEDSLEETARQKWWQRGRWRSAAILLVLALGWLAWPIEIFENPRASTFLVYSETEKVILGTATVDFYRTSWHADLEIRKLDRSVHRQLEGAVYEVNPATGEIVKWYVQTKNLIHRYQRNDYEQDAKEQLRSYRESFKAILHDPETHDYFPKTKTTRAALLAENLWRKLNEFSSVQRLRDRLGL